MRIGQVHFCKAKNCLYNHASECYTNPELDVDGSCMLRSGTKRSPFYPDGYGPNWSTPFPYSKILKIMEEPLDTEVCKPRFYIQETLNNFFRIYLENRGITATLRKWLNAKCICGCTDKETECCASWELNEKIVDMNINSVTEVMSAHGFELEQDPKNAKWLR